MRVKSAFSTCSIVLAIFVATTPTFATLVFTETVGTPSATTAIPSYTGWDNQGDLTFTGTGDVRTTTPSMGYAGASGNGNVFLTNNGTANLQIASIDTSVYLPTFTLAFGAFKNTLASNFSELLLQYSSNGTTYTSIPIPAQPTGTGTAAWRLITLSNITLPTVSNLRLRWTNTGSGGGTPQFRVDDISLSGTAIPEPGAFLFGGLVCCIVGMSYVGRKLLAKPARQSG